MKVAGDRGPRRDLIVIGASAGSTTALCELVRTLPPDLPATVLVAQHFPPSSRSFLPNILRRAGPLPAEHARDGDTIAKGRIYVAPSGVHTILRDGRLALVHGPQHDGRRPSIDVLFRSAAVEYGRRTIGILLSGLLDDGTAGLTAVKRRGGVALVQDPNEARYPDMPRNAIASVAVDHILPVARITERLLQLTSEALSPDDQPPPEDALDYENAEVIRSLLLHRGPEAVPSPPPDVDVEPTGEDKEIRVHGQLDSNQRTD